MKNLIKTIFILVLSLLAFTSQATTVTVPTEVIHQMEANRITNRLEEINAMDKSGLTSLQKKELRNEVKSLKEAGRSNRGVYLSLGAIIIIVLLLIILL